MVPVLVHTLTPTRYSTQAGGFALHTGWRAVQPEGLRLPKITLNLEL